MKKLFIPAMALVLLASCSENTESFDSEPVEIRLGAGMAVSADAVKSPVNSGDSFVAAIGGWVSEQAVDYKAAASWLNTATIVAGTTEEEVDLNPVRYYDADPDKVTYMKAWYPAGDADPANGVVTFENTDGQTDPLLAAEVSGSKRDYASKNLHFSHPTTQIKFKIKGTDLEPGTQIKSISLKDVNIPTGFDLAANSVTYTAKALLPVPEVEQKEITATAEAAGNAVMIEPIASTTFDIVVETNKYTFDPVTVTVNGDTGFNAGKAYEIELTFVQHEIKLSATVAEWETGGEGGASFD